MFYPWCFIYLFRHEIIELPRPIVVKLCHTIGNWMRFIMQVQKFGGNGAKTCRISVDFLQLQIWSRISPEQVKISKTGKTCEREWFLLRSTKKSGELWSTNYRELHVSLDTPKWTFAGDYISAIRGCCPLKFLHELDWPRLGSAHPNGDSPPPPKKK